MSATEQAELTCHHCGEVKTDAEMERLSSGWRSDCCKACWYEYQKGSVAYVNRMVNGGWAAMVEVESREVSGGQDSRLKVRSNRPNRKHPKRIMATCG
jgi:hypothetical protein